MLVGTLVLPVARLVSRTVPPLVPSLCHTWNPLLVVNAEKYTVPDTSVRFDGRPPSDPLMSATIPAPPPEPLDHNWLPVAGSFPEKYSVLPTAVSSVGPTPPPDAFDVVSIVADPYVGAPIDQSCDPSVPSLPTKYSVVPTAVS